MDALRACYEGSSESEAESDSDDPSPPPTTTKTISETSNSLPPPPLSLLTPCNSFGAVDFLQSGQASRVRNFPHVEGNYALHVYIPVFIPIAPKKELAQFLKKVAYLFPDLHVIDVDIPLAILCKDDQNLEQVALGREFHISLGRTVPIRVHQIDTVMTMLRQKLQFQRRYWIDFSKWEVFVNDDRTRTFLSIEVITGGLPEITKQIQAVNEVYRLHNLPEFYKDPRPHISLAWASGDIDNSLKKGVEEIEKSNTSGGSSVKRIFSTKFSGIVCKIGNKTYKISKFPDD